MGRRDFLVFLPTEEVCVCCCCSSFFLPLDDLTVLLLRSLPKELPLERFLSLGGVDNADDNDLRLRTDDDEVDDEEEEIMLMLPFLAVLRFFFLLWEASTCAAIASSELLYDFLVGGGGAAVVSLPFVLLLPRIRCSSCLSEDGTMGEGEGLAAISRAFKSPGCSGVTGTTILLLLVFAFVCCSSLLVIVFLTGVAGGDIDSSSG